MTDELTKKLSAIILPDTGAMKNTGDVAADYASVVEDIKGVRAKILALDTPKDVNLAKATVVLKEQFEAFYQRLEKPGYLSASL